MLNAMNVVTGQGQEDRQGAGAAHPRSATACGSVTAQLSVVGRARATLVVVDDDSMATSGWARRLWPTTRAAQVLVVLSVVVLIAVIVGWCAQAHLLASIGVLVLLLMTQTARLIEDKARIARFPDSPAGRDSFCR